MHYLFSTILTRDVTLEIYLICMVISLVSGGMIAFVGSGKNESTETLILSLVIIPAIVQTIIMLVNGNVGTGVAVAGALSLVKFGSAAGNAKDISLIFLAMTVGIATGTGYLGIAIALTIILCVVIVVIYYMLMKKNHVEWTVKITIPENKMDEINFECVLREFAVSQELLMIKTSEMEKICIYYYHVILKPNTDEKVMLDSIYKKGHILEVSYEKDNEEEIKL